MTENTDVLPDTPTPGSIEQIALQIKSLEQRTTSVTLPRNATVLELKHEIQVAFDVESNRQRLIFQGRVLKDDKSLTDYANLDNGKVIHLVIRPIDAPHNPMNDDPNPGSNIRHTFGRGTPNGRPRTFPSISSRFPMMEGYAFITLDSNLSDLGDNQSLLSSVLNGLSAGGAGLAGLNRSRAANNNNNNTNNTNNNTNSNSNNTTTTNNSDAQATANASTANNGRPSALPGAIHRSPFAFNFGRNNSSDFASPLASSPLADRVASGLPFPPSVEVRLARTLGSMRNVRAMLEDTTANDDSTTFTPAPNSTPEQLQEIRSRLRSSGNNQSAQIGMVLSELADLMTEAAPRMREVSQSLRQENQTNEEERNTSRRVLNMSRIVQGMSLINHFLGSVLASADIDSRRSTGTSASTATTTTATSTTSTTTPSQRSTTTLPSFIFPRGITESIRTSAPNVETSATVPTDTHKNTSTAKPKSTLSNTSSTSNSSSSSSSSSRTNTNRGLKRRLDQVEAESDDSKKSPKNDKGKEKHNKD